MNYKLFFKFDLGNCYRLVKSCVVEISGYYFVQTEP